MSAPAVWPIARSLARVESRKLATSGAAMGGIVLSAFMGLTVGWPLSGGRASSWHYIVLQMPWFVHPIVGTIVIGAHRATRRPARDATAELFETCPAPPVARTIGLLACGGPAMIAPAAVLAAVVGGLLVVDGAFGPFGGEEALILVASVVLGAGGVALGVALGTWSAVPLTPVAALIGVAVATITLNTTGDPDWNPYTWLTTAPAAEPVAPAFTAPPVAAHVVWVLCLVVLVGLLAVLHDDRSRRVAVALGAVAGIGAACAVVITRGISGGEARAIASRVERPADFQTCRTEGRVTACTFAGYEDRRDEILATVRANASALPEESAAVVFRQRLNGDVLDLDPAVRDELTTGPPVLGPYEASIPWTDSLSRTDLPQFQLAFAATGLPREADARDLPYVAAGQARGVVALWIATRDRPTEVAVRLVSSDAAPGDSAFRRGTLEYGECSVPSVVWSPGDLDTARAMVQLDDDVVRRVLHARWEHWTAPSTPTAELRGAIGLPAGGPPETVVPEPGDPC